VYPKVLSDRSAMLDKALVSAATVQDADICICLFLVISLSELYGTL